MLDQVLEILSQKEGNYFGLEKFQSKYHWLLVALAAQQSVLVFVCF